MTSMLFGITLTDPLPFGVFASVMLVVVMRPRPMPRIRKE